MPPFINSFDTFHLKKMKLIAISLSMLLILGDILVTSKLQEVMFYGFAETRIMGYNGDETLTTYTTAQHIGHSILRWLSGLSYLLIMLFFYCVAFVRKNWFLKTLLLVASLSAPYYGLLSAGRTRIIYWVLFFIVSYLLFKNYLNHRAKILTNVVMSSFLFVIIGIMVSISIVRAEMQNLDAIEFFGDYAGKPILNFCWFFDEFDYHPISFYRILPIVSTIAMGRFNLLDYQYDVYNHSNMEINGFNTLLGDFFIDIGVVGMFVVSLFYFSVTQNLMRKRHFGILEICILTILLQIPLHGLFYYSLWQMESSVCSILTIAIGKLLTTRISL